MKTSSDNTVKQEFAAKAKAKKETKHTRLISIVRRVAANLSLSGSFGAKAPPRENPLGFSRPPHPAAGLSSTVLRVAGVEFRGCYETCRLSSCRACLLTK